MTIGREEDVGGRLDAGAPTALSSQATEPASGLRPDGLQSHGAWTPDLYEALTAAANALRFQAERVTEHGSSPELQRKRAVLMEKADAAFAALSKARGDAS